MENNRTVARALRDAAKLGVACVVMLIFVAGFVTIAAARYVNASFDAWRPRSENAARTVTPGSRDFRNVIDALATFAVAVADEILMVLWKPRPL